MRKRISERAESARVGARDAVNHGIVMIDVAQRWKVHQLGWGAIIAEFHDDDAKGVIALSG